MNEKEIAEIRRRFNPQKTNITKVCGCYVTPSGEIMSEFSQPLAALTPDETENLLSILKKTLSGTVDKNLIDIPFSNAQVLEGEEHKTLMRLRDSALCDEEALKRVYSAIISSVREETNYLILLAFDSYDVFTYSSDGKKDDESSEQFRYFVCCVCPVKLTKPLLSFEAFDNAFHGITAVSAVSAPEFGFMFPSFDDRTGNIYDVMFYSKNPARDYSEISDKLFKADMPMPAVRQQESFCEMLEASVGEECSLDVIQAVQDRINDIAEENKENRDREPVAVTKNDISQVLRSCDVTEEHIESFESNYDSVFGEKTSFNPKNLVDVKKMEVNMPSVSIKVDSECSNLVKTRLIDGVKYIMIRADDCVEVNGVKINIKEE